MMGKRLILITIVGVIFTMTSLILADISVDVYEADGNTPFDDRDIMVGEKLTIIVSSDANDYWSGGLFISGSHRSLATLTARDSDPNTRDYELSHYEAAGELAKVTGWQDSTIWGFDLYTSDINDVNFIADDWFIIDYEADAVGDCNVGFYDYSSSWSDPNFDLYFSHIPTRDLDSDDDVDFNDFAVFASEWFEGDCNSANEWCNGTDLDLDGNVDVNDLGLFTEYWLWPHEHVEPVEPNEPEPDPNLVYSILDANDSNEITIDVNDTVTLYVKLDTTGSSNIRHFDIEVNISDANLGSIDNTVIDSNDPLPTAEILSDPNRWSGFDYFGPGLNQEDGIRFQAYHIEAINDGNLASFEFTCTGEGDVTLTLINWYSTDTDSNEVYPTLESILIHQNDPNSGGEGGGGGGEGAAPMGGGEEDSVSEPNTAEMVEFLEEIWVDESVQEHFTQEEYDTFVESVKESQ